jgi:hypothetical protein
VFSGSEAIEGEDEPGGSDLGVKKEEEGTKKETCIAIVNYRTNLKAPR